MPIQFTEWAEVQHFPGGRRDDGCGFALNGFGYYGCGIDDNYTERNDWWRYDPIQKSWTETTALPGLPRQYATVFTSDQRAYLVGGSSGNVFLNEVWRFDPITQRWTRLPDAPFPARSSAVAFRIGDFVWYGSGRADSIQFGDFWRFHLSSESWTKADSLPFEPRSEMIGFSCLGFGYLAIGRNDSITFNDVWQWDPYYDQWNQLDAFPGSARSYATALNVPGGALVAGGMNSTNDLNNASSLLDEVWFMDGRDHSWHPLKSLPIGGVRGMEGFFLEGVAMFIGGLAPFFTRVDAVQMLESLDESLVEDRSISVNLVEDVIRVYVQVEEGKQLTLKLMDVMGKEVLKHTLDGGQHVHFIPAENLSNGFYWLQLSHGNLTSRHILLGLL